MLKIRTRTVVVGLMAWTLPLIGAIGVLAPGPAAAASTARLGTVPAKGISPTCLLVPQDPGCEGGVIS